MINQYETVFIMTPVLSEEQMKEAVKKYETFLVDKGAEIVHSENRGLRKLAYPIQKKTTGFYHLFEFRVDTSVIDQLEVTFRRDEKILRFLTTKQNKYMIEYNESRRKKAKEKQASQEA